MLHTLGRCKLILGLQAFIHAPLFLPMWGMVYYYYYSLVGDAAAKKHRICSNKYRPDCAVNFMCFSKLVLLFSFTQYLYSFQYFSFYSVNC